MHFLGAILPSMALHLRKISLKIIGINMYHKELH